MKLISKDAALKILNDLGGTSAGGEYFRGWEKAIDGVYKAINELETIDYNPEEIKELKNENVRLKNTVNKAEKNIDRLRTQIRLIKLAAGLNSEE